jgi:hypothetical protein
MKFGDLSSLFQLGVGLNFGFGAIVVFAEPARRQFERALATIEPRLLELSATVEAAARNDKRIGEVFSINKSYLELLGRSKLLSLESVVWQSITARLVFMVAAAVSLCGLVVSSYWAETIAPLSAIALATGVDLIPIGGAILLCVVSCWYEFTIFPRVEILQQRLLGRRTLLSAKYGPKQ